MTLTSTFTKGAATATTELRLASLPRPKSMTWWGTKGAGRGISWNGVGAVAIRMAGTVTYSGMDNPACNGTVRLDTSRWRPITASVALVYSWNVARARLSAGAGRFPVATIYPRRGGACENGALTWWQPGAVGTHSFSFFRRSAFSVSSSNRETFDDGSTLEWSARMTVRRIYYRPIDCRRAQLC